MYVLAECPIFSTVSTEVPCLSKREKEREREGEGGVGGGEKNILCSVSSKSDFERQATQLRWQNFSGCKAEVFCCKYNKMATAQTSPHPLYWSV